jgi:hypothetical protein
MVHSKGIHPSRQRIKKDKHCFLVNVFYKRIINEKKGGYS